MNVVNKDAMTTYIFAPLVGGVIAGLFGAMNESVHKNIENEEEKSHMTLIHRQTIN